MKSSVIIISIFLLNSCMSGKERGEVSKDQDLSDNSVILSREQIRIAGIQTGYAEKMVVGDEVKCTGKIEIAPDAIAVVSAPIGGTLKKAYFNSGMYVNKGSVMAILEHPDFIKLQQEYLETKNQLDYMKEEFKRQGELTVENASSIKKMQQAQVDFRVTEVRLFALKAHLEMIGINADSLDIENIKSSFSVYAPMSGFITEADIRAGVYVNPGELIYEIENVDRLNLNLDVPENEIHKIKPGQKIIFRFAGDHETELYGITEIIGQKINTDKNTYEVQGSITTGNSFLKPGMHITSQILLTTDSVMSLPSEAIVHSGTKKYLFIAGDSLFTKIEVQTGKSSDERIEIAEFSAINQKIVIKGANFLNSELEASNQKSKQ